MQDRTIGLLALGTIVASAGLSAVVVTTLTPAPRESVASTRDDEAFVRELGALRTILEARDEPSLQPASAAAASRRLEGDPVPGLAAGDVDHLIAAIERLELTLRDEHAALRQALVDSGARAAEASERRAEVDWASWNELWGVYQGDEQAARDRVRLLTTAQLLARFGAPTEVSSRENGTRMWYYYTPDESEPLNVQVEIVDGYVTRMWMEL